MIIIGQWEFSGLGATEGGATWGNKEAEELCHSVSAVMAVGGNEDIS